MKFTVDKKQIIFGMDRVSGAVASKTIRPILSGVMFKKKDEKTFELISTDLETYVKTEIKVLNSDQIESFVVEAILLREIVRSLPEKEIIFEKEDNNISVKSGKAAFYLPTMNPEEFPEFQDANADNEIHFSLSVLELMLERSIFCSNKDELMKHLNGLYWEYKDGFLRIVAADGFRMAVTEEKIDKNIESSFFLTLKSMTELLNTLRTSNSDDLSISFDDSKVSFIFDNTTLVTRIADIEFPNYKAIIPKGFKAKVIVNKNEFIQSTRRSEITAKLGSHSVLMNIIDDVISINSSSPEQGEANEDIFVKKEGEDLKISLNPRYLLESLKKIDSDSVELGFVGYNLPVQLNPLDIEGYFYIIMPIRLIDE